MQLFTSAETSINNTKRPAIYNKIAPNFNNAIVFDYGCGKFTEHIKKFVEENGGEYYGFDKFNQPENVNELFYEKVHLWFNNMIPKKSVFICSNVLNVIDDISVIKEIFYFSTCFNFAYFAIYEGDKSGIGRQTKKDCYQRNETTVTYLNQFKSWMNDFPLNRKFRHIARHGNIITGVKI